MGRFFCARILSMSLISHPSLQLEPLFPLALARAQLNLDPLDLAIWIQQVLALRGKALGNPQAGCAWTGDINGIWQLHRLPVFASLVRQLHEQVEAYLVQLGFDPSQVVPMIQRSWPVVSEQGQQVGRHHHPNAHLSALIYLNGDGLGETGCLRLFAPHQSNELVPGLAVGHGGPLLDQAPARLSWNAPWVDVAPVAGLLLLFPAAVDHAVTENCRPDEQRLSIAFDLVLCSPETCVEALAPPEYLAPHPSHWDPLRQD